MDVKKLLKDKQFGFNKRYGQNFLTDDALLAQIVAEAGITQNDTVLEIGAGAGTLTRQLAKSAKNVIAFEIDTNLKSVLEVTLDGLSNVQVVFGDVMKLPMSEIHRYAGDKPFKVVANIPYYITTPIVTAFVENSNLAESLTLTVQKEVAERFAASEGCKDYGSITVAVQAVADVKILRVLDRSLFYPIPNVDSAVVSIVFDRTKYGTYDKEFFRKTVKTAFAMRRKTLVNNLTNIFGISKQSAENLLGTLGIPAGVRGEQLSVAQFVLLSESLMTVIRN
ncbi:MAG: 16S rRNA (adenine(1518)-N(6)/adenine(1519)-N(6))-dimethyltransferase RsmA [Corallococcus sp.]|nr:16S rRNA (adenine(1518)-N(6)/adenine(1519)-N(6))-dimethyltransferase RsmA [Corallococcus sp.]